MTIMSAGHCDLWNNGVYTQCQFGPTGKGNDLGIYDESLGIWKMVEHSGIDTIDIDHCLLDTGSGPVANQALLVGHTYLVSNRLNPDTGNIDTIFTPLGPVPELQNLSYVRADPDSGIMCAAGSRRWRVTGMCHRHPVYGIQGQANSEYLIGRHDLWSVGLESVPGFPSPFTFPSDSQWYPVGPPIEFCTWGDRLPMGNIKANLVFFNNTVGASLSAYIAVNHHSLAMYVPPGGEESGAHVDAATCAVANTPIKVQPELSFNGARGDAYYSAQLYVRCNMGVAKLGAAYNSLFSAGIWF